MKLQLSLLAAALLTGACAGKNASVNDEIPTIDATGARQYEGTFRPMQQAQSRIGSPTQQRVYGSIRLLFREATAQTNVRLTLSTNASQSEILTWSVNPGRCNSGSVALLPVSQFPPIDMGSTGNGTLEVASMSLSIPPTGSHHVNIYRGGDNLSNVIACASLSAK